MDADGIKDNILKKTISVALEEKEKGIPKIKLRLSQTINKKSIYEKVDIPEPRGNTNINMEIHSCMKCFRVFKNNSNLALHKETCLKLEKGESFFKYEQRKKSYDTTNKILPLSQASVTPSVESFAKPVIDFHFSFGKKSDEKIEVKPEYTPIKINLNINHNKLDIMDKQFILKCTYCDVEKFSSSEMAKDQEDILLESRDDWFCQDCKDRIVDIQLPDFEKNEDKIIKAKLGDMEGKNLEEYVDRIYKEVVRWRRNLFYLPTGKVGEDFISEVTKIVDHFNNGTVFESISLAMLMIIFPLLLQKPSQNSKTKDHVRYLEKRLEMWKCGKLQDLFDEGRAIQNRFSKKKKHNNYSRNKRFIKLMEKGKVSAALRCIGSLQSNLLDVTPEIMKELKSKHPESKKAVLGSVIQGPLPKRMVEEVIYENLDAESIHSAAKKISGAAGPSGADADLWQRLLCSKQFKKKPVELCRALADLAKKLSKKILTLII